MCICIYICMYIYVYIYVYICIYIYMYVCMYVYTYICIYICTYIYAYNTYGLYMYMWKLYAYFTSQIHIRKPKARTRHQRWKARCSGVGFPQAGPLPGCGSRENTWENHNKKWGTHNGWSIMENPIRMDDDWGYPYDLGKPHLSSGHKIPQHHSIESWLVYMDSPFLDYYNPQYIG